MVGLLTINGGKNRFLHNWPDGGKLLDLIDEAPDRTLDEIVSAMHKRRIPGSRTALWRFLDRHRITLKLLVCGKRSRLQVPS